MCLASYIGCFLVFSLSLMLAVSSSNCGVLGRVCVWSFYPCVYVFFYFFFSFLSSFRLLIKFTSWFWMLLVVVFVLWMGRDRNLSKCTCSLLYPVRLCSGCCISLRKEDYYVFFCIISIFRLCASPSSLMHTILRKQTYKTCIKKQPTEVTGRRRLRNCE